MLHRPYLVILSTLALALTGSASASAATPLGPVSVRVPQKPSVTTTLAVSFHPRGRLPHGGYYYAVIVLEHYNRSSAAPPACAISSDMRRTAYGYPRRDGAIHLTLLPAKSAKNRWCAEGTYEGAIYAVPHKPPCSKSYPCYGLSTQSGGCWEVEAGRRVCGVVIRPSPYSYPGGLPKPLDHSTHIVGRFQIKFGPGVGVARRTAAHAGDRG